MTRKAHMSDLQTFSPERLLMPAEGAPHATTWMAYGATPGAWGEDTSSPFGRDIGNSRTLARQDLMRIAANLSRFEPVAMLVDSAEDEAEARGFLADIIGGVAPKDQLSNELDDTGRIFTGGIARSSDIPPIDPNRITFFRSPLDDLWTRDTAPVFVRDAARRLHAVDLNFNGWGQWPISTALPGWCKDAEKTRNGVLDQPVDRDRGVAAAIARLADAPIVDTWLTMEGGGLEVNGAGLGIAMESCIVNSNRNPGKRRAEIESELRRLFGIEHMLWMPGVTGVELTDWHVDFTARFVGEDLLVFAFDEKFEPSDQRNRKALESSVAEFNGLRPERRTALLGSPAARLSTRELPTPDIEKVYASVRERNAEHPITTRTIEEFALTTAPGYIGYYEANGCIIMSQFGDAAADRLAFDRIAELYPDRVVIQISTDGLMSGGGTIHCATQQQPVA